LFVVLSILKFKNCISKIKTLGKSKTDHEIKKMKKKSATHAGEWIWTLLVQNKTDHKTKKPELDKKKRKEKVQPRTS
jgi:hypothetical protein